LQTNFIEYVLCHALSVDRDEEALKNPFLEHKEGHQSQQLYLGLLKLGLCGLEQALAELPYGVGNGRDFAEYLF
jgi:hypothetical protein